MEIVFIIVGLLIGVLLGWFIAKSNYANRKGLSEVEAAQLKNQFDDTKLELRAFTERNTLLKQELEEKDSNLKSEREKYLQLNSDFSSLKSDHSNLREKLNEQKAELEKLQEKFTKEFENLANKIFDEKSSKFTEQNKSNLDQLLKPLGERIKDFEKRVNDIYTDESKQRASLREHLKQLQELNQQMSKDATNLTNALKGQTKTQGSWGEFILESILEKSGLEKDREYFLQESFTTGEGKRFQPDVIIKLPEEKNIIIDSKVSLVAYEKFVSSETDDERIESVKSHILSIRNHLKNLNHKGYQDNYKLKNLDFILMFMPIEPAFALAVQHDAELFNDAFGMNIVIVSPSTLLATLRTIASIWRQEKQNANAMEIAKQSGALYDKFCGFVDDLESIGKSIDTARGNYDTAMNKLKTGRGNLISRAEKIKKIGVKASKSLSPSILDSSDLEGSENLSLEDNDEEN